MGRDSSLSIGTHYRLEGSGSDPGGGEIFHTRPDRPWGPPTLLHKWYRVIKRARRGVDHPPPSSAKVKERVELYLCSSSVPSWSCTRVNCTFYLSHLTHFVQQLSVICYLYICTFIHRVSPKSFPARLPCLDCLTLKTEALRSLQRHSVTTQKN